MTLEPDQPLTRTRARTDRVNEIDLLRFIAALAVVMYHYAFRGYTADHLSALPYRALVPVAKYGYLGVELFFLISGFVILMTASHGGLRAFVASRVARLYPAFWICCTITFLVLLLFGAPRFSVSLPQFLVNLTMLSKFVGVDSIDGAYWSLFVEMQFYLFVGILLWLKQMRHVERFMVVWLLASFALTAVPSTRLRDLLIADYSGYFIGGSACYLLWAQRFTWLTVALFVASWPLALWNSLARLPYIENKFQVSMSVGVVAAIVSAFFAIMLLIALRRTGFIARRRWITVGALTYPLYLLHQYIGYTVFNRLYPFVNANVLFWGTVAAVLVLAYAVHVFVERPIAPRLKRLIAETRFPALWRPRFIRDRAEIAADDAS